MKICQIGVKPIRRALCDSQPYSRQGASGLQHPVRNHPITARGKERDFSRVPARQRLFFTRISKGEQHLNNTGWLENPI